MGMYYQIDNTHTHTHTHTHTPHTVSDEFFIARFLVHQVPLITRFLFPTNHGKRTKVDCIIFIFILRGRKVGDGDW